PGARTASRPWHRLPAWRGPAPPAGPAPPCGSRRLGACGARVGGRVDLVLVEAILPEVHDVRKPELRRLEVDGEERRQARADTPTPLQELLSVGPLLVPVGEQRRRDVPALAVPRLRHHVRLL